MTSKPVIVFGPTGKIASVAARTAREHGAKVILAMRDTQKSIPGLSSEEEAAGGYERMQADLSQPETVSAVIKKTGAKHAFFYLIFSAKDRMKATIQAMKDAGLELPIFLSSYTITKDVQDVEAEDLIPYAHAQVELSLQEIFTKDHYIAIRPGNFATNTLRFAPGVKEGEVPMPYPEAKGDMITPTDMGRVSGNVLVKGKQYGEYYVYLFGPDMVSGTAAMETIGGVLNKSIKINPLYGDAATEHMTLTMGMGETFAAYFNKVYENMSRGDDRVTGKPWFAEGRANVEKYSGYKAQTYREWVEENKEAFT